MTRLGGVEFDLANEEGGSVQASNHSRNYRPRLLWRQPIALRGPTERVIIRAAAFDKGKEEVRKGQECPCS